MAVLDASVLVALLDTSNPNHGAAKALVAKADRVALTAGTILETSTVLRRLALDKGQDGHRVAREALHAVRCLPTFRDTGDGLVARSFARYQSTSLSFADAWAIEAALEDEDELLTFDKAQAKTWNAER